MNWIFRVHTVSFGEKINIKLLSNQCYHNDLVLLLSHVQLFCNTHWVFPSMGFPRKEHWSVLSFPSPGKLNPRIKPMSPALQVDSLPLSHQGSLSKVLPWQKIYTLYKGEKNANNNTNKTIMVHHFTPTSRIKILQASLQQYVNRELPDV